MARQPIPGVCAHARDRMAERIGRDLTRVEWLDAVARILDGRAVRLAITPHGSEHYLHEIGGLRLRLVWKPGHAEIVTVFPGDWSPTRMLDEAREARLRQTLAMPAHFRRGKRLSARTCRVPPEERG